MTTRLVGITPTQEDVRRYAVALAEVYLDACSRAVRLQCATQLDFDFYSSCYEQLGRVDSNFPNVTCRYSREEAIRICATEITLGNDDSEMGLGRYVGFNNCNPSLFSYIRTLPIHHHATRVIPCQIAPDNN